MPVVLNPLPTPRFPIQWKVLTFLYCYGPRTVDFLAREFDISTEPLRYYLELLRDEGYVELIGGRYRERARWCPDDDDPKSEAGR